MRVKRQDALVREHLGWDHGSVSISSWICVWFSQTHKKGWEVEAGGCVDVTTSQCSLIGEPQTSEILSQGRWKAFQGMAPKVVF